MKDEEMATTGIIADAVLEHADKFMTPVLMVDNILKAESKAAAAYYLVEFINFLEVKRTASEQTLVCLYAKTQAYSYRPDFAAVIIATAEAMQREMDERREGRA